MSESIHPFELQEEAFRLGDEGNYSDALQIWELLSNLPSLDIENKCMVLLCKRRCHSELGQHEMAERTLRQIEQLDSNHTFWVEIAYSRIDDLRSQGKIPEATKALKQFWDANRVVLASPQYINLGYELRLTLGCALIDNKQSSDGLELLTELLPLALEQHKRTIHFYCGSGYLELERIDAAIAEFKSVIDSVERDLWTARAHYELGLIYFDKGAYARAIHHLENAELLKDLLDFPASYIYRTLSNVYVKLNELDKARHFRKLADN